MSPAPLLPFAAAALLFAGPPVEAVPLDGETVAGSLSALTADAAVVAAEDGERSVPLTELAELRFGPPPADLPTSEAAVRLRDGSVLAVSDATITAGRLTATVPGLGELELPAASVRSVRFRPLPAADVDAWEELATSAPDGDLAVVRRGGKLDRLTGSVGGVGAETVAFLLNGSPVDLPRGRANFVGVVFAGPADPAKPAAVVRPHAGGELRVRELAWAAGTLRATLTDGSTVDLPAGGVASVDFAAGSVTPLADLPTREPSETTTGWADDPWPVGRDRNLRGDPISIAGRTFDRGLVLHAPATLEWRLPPDARRLRAVLGIEDARRTLGVGEVVVQISGDGKELFSQRITHADDPVPLDLDLAGVRTLTLTVNVGDDPFAGDHLALGNARITK